MKQSIYTEYSLVSGIISFIRTKGITLIEPAGQLPVKPAGNQQVDPCQLSSQSTTTASLYDGICTVYFYTNTTMIYTFYVIILCNIYI